MVLPPAIQALMHSPPAGTPEQQVHQAAAAAAAAAAVMSSPYSTYSTMMLPPSIIPLGALLTPELAPSGNKTLLQPCQRHPQLGFISNILQASCGIRRCLEVLRLF